jgi:actin-related protein 6
MYHNVLLVGGNAKIPGYKERVEMELRKLAPVNYVVRVFLPDDPVSYAWEVSTCFKYQE